MTNRGCLTRLPIIAIGGFLGAGKTTLVNRILKQMHGQRVVVLVNDFGAINIDHELVQTVASDRISLANGCVCCTLNDDLVSQIAKFAHQRPQPDCIIVEASGIADPRALDASFHMLEAAGLTRLDSRIGVIDASGSSVLGFDDTELMIDHCSASDIVLLNKTDLISRDTLQELQEMLEDAAPSAVHLATVKCNVEATVITGFGNRCSSQRPPVGELTNGLAGDPHNHLARYETWSYETDRLLLKTQFEAFARLLPGRALRAKGVLRFAEAPTEAQIFNLVGYRATLEPAPQLHGSPGSKIVVIGTVGNLRAAELEPAFLNMLAPK